MPTMPRKTNLNLSAAQAAQTGPDILNAIRNGATQTYRDAVPVATADNAPQIGDVLLNYSVVGNEFIDALINRIALTIVSSTMMENPFRAFQRGLLRVGETVQEIFVRMAEAHNYDPEEAETEVFKREIPQVAVHYHTLNFRARYKMTVQFDSLRQAFTSWEGVVDFVGQTIQSMYSAAYYDEYQCVKYMLAKAILSGNVATVATPAPDGTNDKDIVVSIKKVANKFPFGLSEYNGAGEITRTRWEDMLLIKTGDFDASVSVNVLADAFNVDKAEFLGNQVLIDDFYTINQARLAAIVGADFAPLTAAELNTLKSYSAMLVDRNFFFIFSDLFRAGDIMNPQGIYWNYNLHNWKIMSYSTMVNAVAFGPATTPPAETIIIKDATGNAITAPLNLTIAQANGYQFGTNAKVPIWSIAPTTVGVSISNAGVLTYTATAGGTYTVTCFAAGESATASVVVTA